MTPTRLNALWNHFGKTILQIGKWQNKNESSNYSGNIQGCADTSNLIWLVVLRAVLKAIRVNIGDPALVQESQEWASHGRSWNGPLRASIPPPMKRPLWIPIAFPVGPWHVSGIPAPLSLGTRHSGLLGAPCGGPVAFPMGSRSAHCGTPRAPTDSRFSKPENEFSKPRKRI